MTSPNCYSPGRYASGAPSPADLAALAEAGVRTVISLRTAIEAPDDPTSEITAALGMRYVRLPIAGPADLDEPTIRRFGELLDDACAKGGVLVHCATANRVGALVALDAALNNGLAPDAALALGRTAGLTGLEPAVVERLSFSG